jgi:hypothetical protein
MSEISNYIQNKNYVGTSIALPIGMEDPWRFVITFCNKRAHHI